MSLSLIVPMANCDPSLKLQYCASSTVLYSYNSTGLTDIEMRKIGQASFGSL